MSEENLENKKDGIEEAAAVPSESAAEEPKVAQPEAQHVEPQVDQPVEEVKEEVVAPVEEVKAAPKAEPKAEPEIKEEAKEEPKAEPVAEEEEVAEAPKEEKVAAEKAKEPEVSEEDRKWFVIQTFSGQEEKVKANIEREVAHMNMGHKIFRVLVPEEETLEIKGSKRIEKVKKMFPGYVFVEMALDDESWYVIRQTPGVARFIGSGMRPQPVVDREMQRVLKQIGVKEEKLEVLFDINETVRVISGPFRGYTGTVNEVNADKGKLKILISIFGRDTPVEVNFEHAEKIN